MYIVTQQWIICCFGNYKFFNICYSSKDMDGSKISAVTSLLVDLKGSEHFREESKVHIDEVIKCIQDLYNRYLILKSDHEAATIDAGTMWRRYQRIYDGSQHELEAACKTAKVDNETLSRDLRRNVEQINDESEEQKQKAEFIKWEKKEMEEKERLIKVMWPEISTKVSTMLEQKSIAKMKVNDTRCRIIEAHKKSHLLEEEADELREDIEEYWNYCRSQMSKIKPQGDNCRAKIALQQERTNQAKSSYEEADKKFRRAQKKYSAQEKITATREAHTEEIRVKRIKQDTILGHKRKRFSTAVHDLEKLQEKQKSETEKYERKIAVLERKLRVVVEETKREIEDKERMTKERRDTVSTLEYKKERCRLDIIKMKQKKTALLDTTSLLDSATEESGFTKCEREELNSRISTIMKYRELTRSIYDRKISRLEEDLEREEVCRKTELSQVKELIETLHEERDKMSDFMKSGEKQLNVLVDKKALWIRQKSSTSESADLFKAKMEKLVHDEEITQRYNEIVIQELREEIAKTQINCDNSKISIEQLQERHDEFEPIHRRVCKEFADLKESHTNTRNTIVNLNRTVRDKNHEKERKYKEIKELERRRQNIKNEIAETNAQATEYFKNLKPLKKSNMQVCQEMLKHRKLHQENFKLKQACKETSDQVKDAHRLMTFTQNKMNDMKKSLLKKRNTLVDSVQFTMEQTDQARIRDVDLIDDITAKRDFSQYRHSALDSVIVQMVEIMTTMDDFQAGKKRLQKSSVCKGQPYKTSYKKS